MSPGARAMSAKRAQPKTKRIKIIVMTRELMNERSGNLFLKAFQGRKTFFIRLKLKFFIFPLI